MFELKNPTRATITSVTLRREKHGEDNVPATTVGVKIMAPNTILDQLDPALMIMFYRAPDEPLPQAEFDETRVVHLPILRSHLLDDVHIKGVLEGWTLHVDYGIDENSAITMGACKVDKFRASMQEGGSVELRFRLGSSDVDEVSVGKLGMLIDNEVSITLTAPEKQPDAIDGSRAAFEADHPGSLFDDLGDEEAGDAFARISEDEGRTDDTPAFDDIE